MEGAMLPAFSGPLGLKLILVHGLVKSVSAVAVCPDLLIYVLQTLILGPVKAVLWIRYYDGRSE